MRLSNIALAVSAQYGGLFKPSSLFTTGVNGAWYDPSDFSTLFQDAEGTTPVTAVGQPVGLMLDKSKGLVPGGEVIPQPLDFTNAAWSTIGTLSVVTSNSFTNISGAGAGKAYIVTPGKRYSVSISYTKSDSSTQFGLYDGGSGSSPVATSTAASGTLTAVYQSSNGVFYLRLAWNATVTVTAISVKELPGNHAFNSSGNSANFPVLSARYNLLTKTEDFSDAVWTKPRVSVNANAVTAPNGTLSADVLTTTTGTSDSIVQSISLPAASFKITLYLKKYNASAASANIGLYSGSFVAVTTRIVSGPGGVSGTTLINVSQLSESEWTLIELTTSALAAGSYVLYIYPGGGHAAGLSVAAWGADLRVANDALNQPAYQRVNTATDYDTVGFKPYLSFNGVNQWLQTNSIDLTYGDKMFVSAGARKLSDAATGVVTELSNSYGNAGFFDIFAPVAAGSATYTLGSGGTSAVALTSPAAYASPATNIISGIGNISAPSAILRVNGSQVAQSTSSQGTGNYGNYPMYIGARAGASLFFNGRLYGLVVAGKSASASEIANTESWLNQKTGAY